MIPRNEHRYAEILVDKLYLESFPNEQSPYNSQNERPSADSLSRFRSKLRWHIKHSLSQRQQQVLELYLQRKTEREIAHILGVTQQVVNIYKHRAIRRLHKILSS